MSSRFYILSGKNEPFFLVDEEGEPGHFDNLERAQEVANQSFMSMAHGYVIIEWNDNGFVEVHE